MTAHRRRLKIQSLAPPVAVIAVALAVGARSRGPIGVEILVALGLLALLMPPILLLVAVVAGRITRLVLGVDDRSPVALRRRPAVGDLVALVVASAAGSWALVATAPGSAAVLLLLVPPLVGIALGRPGRRAGLVGGALGGVAAAASCVAYVSWAVPGGAYWLVSAGLAVMAGMGLLFGSSMGTVAWVVGMAVERLGQREPGADAAAGVSR